VPQFYVPPKNIRGGDLFFDPSESRHLSLVLRKQKGDMVQAFDGEGKVFSVRLADCSDPEKVTGAVVQESILLPTEKKRVLRLYPALFKGPRFEWMLEKAAELGVHSIHPVVTSRTVVKVSEEKAENKTERWEKIVLTAAKQCGRRDLPRVSAPLRWPDALRSVSKEDLNLLLWEGEDQRRIVDVLKDDQRPVNLFIGPEGGISVDEKEEAERSGLIPVRLGDTILRAETAAIAASALVLLGFPSSPKESSR
jgi:16S rRNA (uracil1498-N3)-methyltransferase